MDTQRSSLGWGLRELDPMCLDFSALIYHWGRWALPWNAGRIVSSLSVQKARWQGWNQYSHMACEIELIQSFPFVILAMVKDDLSSSMTTWNSWISNKIWVFCSKKKKKNVWHTMEFSIWGTGKDFREPRVLGPWWACMLFHVYVHFSIKRTLNFYTSITFSRGSME